MDPHRQNLPVICVICEICGLVFLSLESLNRKGDWYKVAFEVARFGLIGEGKVADESPGSAVDPRLVLSGIVTGESRPKVVGESGIVTAVVDCAFEQVNVVHGPSTAKRYTDG
jgi:hypothetical protein